MTELTNRMLTLFCEATGSVGTISGEAKGASAGVFGALPFEGPALFESSTIAPCNELSAVL